MKFDGGVMKKKPDLKKTAWLVFALVFAMSLAIAGAIIFVPDDLGSQNRFSIALAEGPPGASMAAQTGRPARHPSTLSAPSEPTRPGLLA